MKIKFDKDLCTSEISPIKPGKYSLLPNSEIPTNTELFFAAKLRELYDRYEQARFFMFQLNTGDYDSWGIKDLDEKQKQFSILKIQAGLYEASLYFYNTIIDLSWVILYVCSEYLLYDEDGNAKEINELEEIKKSYSTLRKLESIVTKPKDEENPFNYLKKINYKFEKAIELAEDFWASMNNSPIRMNYNYLKHRGGLQYSEIRKYYRLPVNIKITKKVDNKNIECASKIDDVSKIVNLNEEIIRLLDFDNKVLFPYVEKLIILLKKEIKPHSYLI